MARSDSDRLDAVEDELGDGHDFEVLERLVWEKACRPRIPQSLSSLGFASIRPGAHAGERNHHQCT